jgi:hypothetical protein
LAAGKDRILTSHVGSLPRNPDVLPQLYKREELCAIDGLAFDRVVGAVVMDVVAV